MTNRRRILIVEDNVEQAAAMQAVLPCFRVEVAGSVREALGKLRTQCEDPISAILLDLRLPNGQGITVVKAFQVAFPRVPMIVVTGMNEEEVDASRVIRAGAQDMLRKPVDPATLRDTVIRAIVRHEVRVAFSPIEEELEQIKAVAQERCEFMTAAASNSASGYMPRTKPDSDPGKTKGRV